MTGVPRRSSSRSSGAQHWPNSTSCSELLYLITRTDPISCTECTDQQIFRELLHLIFAQRKYRNFGSCSPLSTIILYLSVDDFWASHILNQENILTLRRRKAVAAEADNELSSFPLCTNSIALINISNKMLSHLNICSRGHSQQMWTEFIGQPSSHSLDYYYETFVQYEQGCQTVGCLLLFLLRCLFEESAPQ